MRNIAILLLLSLSYSATEPQTCWSFDQIWEQAFYMFEEITIDGEVVVGDGSGQGDGECYASGTCDVVGAFVDRDGVEVCVGWRYADAAGYTTVALMGAILNMQGDCIDYCDYLYPGEPAYLKIYDSSNGSILDLNPSSELPGFGMNQIFIISGTSTAENNDCEEVYDEGYSDGFDIGAMSGDSNLDGTLNVIDIVYFVDVILNP